MSALLGFEAGQPMRIFKNLALIAAGYGLSISVGVAAVAMNELRISEDIKQTSGGMVAFGDMILFVLAAGFFSLIPTWFLLKLCVEKVPRLLLAAELLVAAMGPASWLALMSIAAAGPHPERMPHALSGVLGSLIAFGAIPRIVFGPVLVMIEAATFLLARQRSARTLLAAAMLMDVVPLGIYAMHMASAIYR